MLNKLQKEQTELARKVILKDSFEKLETIGGVDQAFTDSKIISAIVVCDYRTMNIIEEQYAVTESKLKYVPGFRAYRELPAIVEAYNKLNVKPDVLIVGGHGVTHPRGLGIASHAGLVLDQATIGIANKLIVGEIENYKVVIDKKVKGAMISAKEKSNPIVVSPGHKISLKTSVEIVKNCIRPPHKLPEPLQLAHKLGNKVKKEMK